MDDSGLGAGESLAEATGGWRIAGGSCARVSKDVSALWASSIGSEPSWMLPLEDIHLLLDRAAKDVMHLALMPIPFYPFEKIDPLTGRMAQW